MSDSVLIKQVFLYVDRVVNEEQAAHSSIVAAVQRNRVYRETADEGSRTQFRQAWIQMIREEAKLYRDTSPSDDEHCSAIQRIADNLSSQLRDHLVDGRLRFGTSQKAFNLYLKYLWALDQIPVPPPHCPIDSVVLNSVGITDTWTKCDSREQYMGWITAIRQHLTLAQWETEVWLRWRLNNSGF
jgi:hypothetical protein